MTLKWDKWKGDVAVMATLITIISAVAGAGIVWGATKLRLNGVVGDVIELKHQMGAVNVDIAEMKMVTSMTSDDVKDIKHILINRSNLSVSEGRSR